MQPLKINRFDDKAESRADSGHIFIHDALHNRGFARIVEATVERSVSTFVPAPAPATGSQHQNAHFLLLESCFS